MIQALIQLKSNSIIKIANSNFSDTLSISRGSVVLADYRKV